MERIRIDIPETRGLERVEFEIKSEWHELDFDDLCLAAAYLFAIADDAHLKRGEMFTQLAQMDAKRMRKLGEAMLRDDDGADGMVKLYEVTDFVVKKRPVFYESRSVEYMGYAGPEAGMENIQWQQFARAEICFHKYSTDFHEEDLDQMLSYLYFADEYRADRAPRMYKVVQEWPLAVKLGMLVNYMGLRNFVLNVDEEFQKEEKPREPSAMEALKDEFADDAGPDSALRLPMKIAGEKIGTVDQINRMMVPDVLELIEMMKER